MYSSKPSTTGGRGYGKKAPSSKAPWEKRATVGSPVNRGSSHGNAPRGISRGPVRHGRSGGGSQRKKRFGERIDISMFVKKANPAKPVIAPEITHAFADFEFSEALGRNLAKKGYTLPTPVQDRAIPAIMEGHDVIGLANTGTGKTGAFLLPLIDKVYNDRSQRILIVAPTRELALQIDDEFRGFATGLQMGSAVCVGGTSMQKQMFNLRRNPHFIIGTPGRLKDLGERRLIKFSTFNNVVLDEVDRMLDMGFIDPIKEMMAQVNPERQTLFFSATLPPRIQEFTGQFLVDPVTVEIRSGATSDNVEQDIIRVKDKAEKFKELSNLLRKPGLDKVLIFSETKRDVEKLTKELNIGGFRADSIHGDKRQIQRQRALSAFRDNNVRILVATDVAARGLDIKDITHVINYTVPQTHDDYVHRIGRTGRGNSKGMAYTFVD